MRSVPLLMATTIALAASDEEMADESRPQVSLGFACFSFAAYAKYLVAHLRASGVPVAPGLSEAEFAAVESTYAFTFSPDLRNVLREGLPVGPGFPNWRSASQQQLRLLLGLPADALLREIVAGCIWPGAWGPRPRDREVAEAVAKEELLKAPRLVPVYRNFYLPSTACLPGNPVFYVRGSDVRLAGLDLSDFFRRGLLAQNLQDPHLTAQRKRKEATKKLKATRRKNVTTTRGNFIAVR